MSDTPNDPTLLCRTAGCQGTRLEADLQHLRAERDEARKEAAILKLAVPLEEELSGRIDEMCRHLATEQGFTLVSIARLFNQCRERLATDWLEVSAARRAVKQAEADLTAARQEIERLQAQVPRSGAGALIPCAAPPK